MNGLHLPVILLLVETTDKVKAVLPALLSLVTDGLVEANPTQIPKSMTGKEKVIS